MKKKTVKLVSAVVVLGVLCAAYEGVNYYVTSQEEKETEENDTSVDLVSMEADDITAVSFTADQNEVEFDKKDDSWTEKSDANFPVNQDTVDSAVKGVASLTADQEISDVEDMSQYDLDNPQNTITLTTADGDTSLQIGMESSNNQYYVKKEDDDKNVYLVSSSSIEPFMGTLYDFAESGTFPSVTSATITDVKVDKENSYELTQDADNLFWNVSDGKTTEKADTTKAGTVTSAIGSLAYDKFVDYNCTDDSKYGFDDPYAVITVKYTEDEQETQTSSDTYGLETDVPVVGSIKKGNQLLYVVDIADYTPQIDLWDYKLVTDSYAGESLTFFSDQARNVRVMLIMDGDENFSIYAFNSQTANFYPVSEITSNDQKYYIMSLGACENIPDGLTMEEMQDNTVFYAINQNGSGDYYRYTTTGELVKWENTQANEETTSKSDFFKLVLYFILILVLGCIIGGLAFWLVRKRRKIGKKVKKTPCSIGKPVL